MSPRGDTSPSTTNTPPVGNAGSLNEKQRRFVDLYMGECAGNGSEAARRAGYSGNAATIGVTANRLLKLDKIRAAIEGRVAGDRRVKTRQDLQRFWSRLVDDEKVEIRARLKASELLGKTQGAFIERHQHRLEAGDSPIQVKVVDERDAIAEAMRRRAMKHGRSEPDPPGTSHVSPGETT